MVEEKIINKKYLRKIDRSIEMIPLTFDIVFKGIFEKNLEILKIFLISTLELNLNIDDTKIELLNNELIKENIREYQKRVDILVVLNDTIYIDIEINRSNFERVKLRNSMYCDKLYSMLLDMGDKTTKLNDIYLYQLNLNTKEKYITYGEDKIVSFSLVTKDIFIKNKIMVLKYLEFYRNLYYTNFEKLTESEIWLAALTAKSFNELYEILSHILEDNFRNKLVSEAIRMSSWNFSLHEWNKEKMDELVKDETERIMREEREEAIKKGREEGLEKGIQEGIEQGIQEGIEQGLERGIEQNSIEIIKNMLEKKLAKQLISEITGKTIEEIERIERNN